jgi:hypothetical protein
MITRSVEYPGPVSLTALSAGGMGTADTAGSDDSNVNDGFLGVALRRVSDGAYVASTRARCPAGDLEGYCSGPFLCIIHTRRSTREHAHQKPPLGTPEPIEILAAGVVGETYTIDIIDNYSGGPPNFESFQSTFTCDIISTDTAAYKSILTIEVRYFIAALCLAWDTCKSNAQQ